MPVTDAQFQSALDRIAAIEVRVGITPPIPVPDPVPATPIRADTAAAVRTAIANGARWIQTTGIDLAAPLDCQGALIELLPGGPSWKPAVALGGNAELLNATIKTPPSTFNAAGQRTGFFKALTTSGVAMKIENVTIAPDAGYCVHHQAGKLLLIDFKATTFTEYFVYQDPRTHIDALRPIFRGGSRAESGWRVNAATYRIDDAIFDNSQGGKAAVRGDSPAMPDGSPGGLIRRSRIVGQYGPNPLTEDDGGQMLGVDRWRFAEGWLFQPGLNKDQCIAFAQQLRAAGKTVTQIIRACADHYIDPDKLAEKAKGKRRLTDGDIQLTLDLRNAELGRFSYARVEDSEIIGDIRFNARMKLEIVRTKISGETPFSGNSQSTYPFPINRALSADEAKPAPDISIDQCEIRYTKSIGLMLSTWAKLTATATVQVPVS